MISNDGDALQLATFDRPRLHEQVLKHMTHLIAEGRWSPGTALPAEGELAQRFKVSRTIIRECVRVLASRGMLNVRQGRSIYVTPHAEWRITEPLALLVRSDHMSLLNWLEVRTLLEMDCADLAARRATAQESDLLTELVARQAQCDDDPDAYRDLDIMFHLGIAQATHNPALLRLVEGVIQPLREQLDERALTSQTRHVSTEEHRAILQQIHRGAQLEARAAMAAHLGRVAAEIAALLPGEETRGEERLSARP